MKKVLCIILALCFLFAIAACAVEAPPPPAPDPVAPAPEDPATPDDPPPKDPGDDDAVVEETGKTFPGKIAIVTNTVDQNEEEYRSAQFMQLEFGTDKIIHRTWPVNFSTEGEMMISILQEIANDPEVRGLIINQAVVNTNAAIDKFREVRDDVFIVVCSPGENLDDVAAKADLALVPDELSQGETIVMQAIALGADTLAHYSFARHMSYPLLAGRRDIMREVCEREGIKFVDLTAPDPTSDVGMPGAQLFITQDVPKQVEALGPNTAFFSTNCGMQIPLVTQVIETGAIYPQPCCPSPYHAFPAALGITSTVPTGEFDPETGEEILLFRSTSEVIEATRAVIEARGMSGRLSTWPVSGSMLWTFAGVDYAIEWINGNVPQEHGNIDMDVFHKICDDRILEAGVGAVPVDLQLLEMDGKLYSNYIVGLIDYFTY